MIDLLSGVVLGLTVYTQHIGPTAHEMHSFTPGIYAVVDDHVVLGAVRNSHAKLSTYAGYKFELPLGLDVVAGGITGYSKAPVLPLVTVGRSFDLGHDMAGRVQWLPPTRYSATSFSFSIERRF